MTNERRERIAELVRAEGSARVGQLALRYGVSEVTIRSDLTQLERDGQLLRDRGGATAPSSDRIIKSLLAVEHRSLLQVDEKRRIAMAAATLVAPGESILLDAGTTVIEMVPYLAEIQDLTIVTHATNVVAAVTALTKAKLIVLGGVMSRESGSALGPLTIQTLSQLNVSKTFLGTQAVDLEHGLTDTTFDIAQVKRAMIEAGRECILLADSSKWHASGFIKVAPLAQMTGVVTDNELSAAAQAAVRKLGIQLRLV